MANVSVPSSLCAAPVSAFSSAEDALGLRALPGGLPALERLFERHGVTTTGRRLVLEALRGEPVRRVGGGARNVVVRFASRKVGRVIQAESRTVELAFVYSCEHDANVFFYLCQPVELTVRIVDSRGRRRGIRHVPDFLVLDDTGFACVECKPATALEEDAARPSPRFVRDAGRWRWPAAEEALAPHGIGHRMYSSDEVNPLWIRNIKFLSDYLAVPVPSDARAASVLKLLARHRSLRVCDLLDAPGSSAQTVWGLIAHSRAWCDLAETRVFECHTAWVHDSESRMLAHRHLAPAEPSPAPAVSDVRLESGTAFEWDGVPWRVLNRGPRAVTMQCADGSDRIVELPLDDCQRLLCSGALRPPASALDEGLSAEREALFLRASDADLARARARMEALRRFDRDGVLVPDVSRRSLARFRRWAKEGEQRYGSAFAGLVRFRGRKPGTSDLTSAQSAVLDEFVEAHVDDERDGRVSARYARLVDVCRERGVDPPPSERTLRRAIARASGTGSVRARRGARAAYQASGPVPRDPDGFPVHGDRVWEVAHLDHVLLDVRLVSSLNGAQLGSCWLTLLMDAFSRLPLASALSFDAPSREAVSAVFHDCVRRHHRVPDSLVLDQGPEFRSNDLEAALAYLEVHKVERPASRPRFGAVVERIFGVINTDWIHELFGHSKLVSLGRGLSSSHHPSRHAAWTLPLLQSVLEEWLFGLYPGRVHGTLGETPRAVFEASLARDGERVARYVADDLALQILLAQTPRGVTRHVDRDRGIVLTYLPYWHDDFQYEDIVGTDVPVKVQLADTSTVFARVRGRWVVCRLTAGDADLHGRSWRQIRLVVETLRQQRREGRRRRIDAHAIGEFLRRVDHTGDLARQIARDAERVAPPPPPPSPSPPALRVVAASAHPSDPGAGPPLSGSRVVDASEIDFTTLEPFEVG